MTVLTLLAQVFESGLPERGTRFIRFMALRAGYRYVFACQNKLRIGIVSEPQFLPCPGGRSRMTLSARALELASVRFLVAIGTSGFEALESGKTELFAGFGRAMALFAVGFRVFRDQLKL